jgi:CubicO group peptidase (beta-lactamase class C family)
MNFAPLKEFMDRMTTSQFPGNGIRVCVDGKQVFSYASGYADMENQIPMTTDHYLNIYSCSKVATVTAALQLYEQGYFLLDEPLYAFIPEFRQMYVADSKGTRRAETPITLRHLFTMTSGFTYNRNTQAFQKARELTGGKMDLQTVVRCLATDPLAFEPGTAWGYSLSHDVLGAVVEVISGKRFSQYVKENIFQPLDMTCACYHNEAVQDKMAVQYRFVEGRHEIAGPANSGTMGPEYDNGGGGITTTISDYSKFCAALACGGTGATGERILSPGAIALMRENQLTPQQMQYFNWPYLKGYGYGLGVRTLVDKAASGSIGNLGEFGWCGAAGAMMLIDPQLKLSVFYAHHMLNAQEEYYRPRLRNVIYQCVL